MYVTVYMCVAWRVCVKFRMKFCKDCIDQTADMTRRVKLSARKVRTTSDNIG